MMRFFVFILLVVFSSVAGAQEQQWSAFDQAQAPQAQPAVKQKREPNVEIWLPPSFRTSEEKWPVIVYSHPFGGCARYAKTFMKGLADAGYIVVAPDHKEADCRGGYHAGTGLLSLRSNHSIRPDEPLRTPERWTEKTESERAEDLSFAIHSLLEERQYKNYVDVDRVGVIGDGLGGYSALGVSGGWNIQKEKGVKAVFLLNPYVSPYLLNRGLSRIAAPVFFVNVPKSEWGTLSASNNRAADVWKAFERIPSDESYYLEWNETLDGFAGDALSDAQKEMLIAARVFFNHAIKGQADTVSYQKGKKGVARFVDKNTEFAQ